MNHDPDNELDSDDDHDRHDDLEGEPDEIALMNGIENLEAPPPPPEAGESRRLNVRRSDPRTGPKGAQNKPLAPKRVKVSAHMKTEIRSRDPVYVEAERDFVEAGPEKSLKIIGKVTSADLSGRKEKVDAIVNVRMTASEKALLKQQAGDKSISEFCRDLLINSNLFDLMEAMQKGDSVGPATRYVGPSEKIVDGLKEVGATVWRAGAKQNQIIERLNSIVDDLRDRAISAERREIELVQTIKAMREMMEKMFQASK